VNSLEVYLFQRDLSPKVYILAVTFIIKVIVHAFIIGEPEKRKKETVVVCESL
jgi:hypothetical protein